MAKKLPHYQNALLVDYLLTIAEEIPKHFSPKLAKIVNEYADLGFEVTASNIRTALRYIWEDPRNDYSETTLDIRKKLPKPEQVIIEKITEEDDEDALISHSPIGSKERKQEIARIIESKKVKSIHKLLKELHEYLNIPTPPILERMNKKMLASELENALDIHIQGGTQYGNKSTT